MGLPSGFTNNPNGRPKGSKNKSNEAIRKTILNLIENNLINIQEDIEKLNSRDRLKFILALLPFAIPKYRALELTQNDGMVSDFELREMVNSLFPEELKNPLDDQ